MARVAVAYVEVRPDLSKFGDLLQAQLKSSFANAITNAMKEAGKGIDKETKRLGKSTSRGLNDVTRRASRESGSKAGKDWADSFAKTMKVGINLRLGQMAPILAGIAVAAAPLAQIVSSLGAGLTSLAAAGTEMAGAVGIAGVSALMAFGQAAGVATFATQGFKESLKALTNIQSKQAAGVVLTAGDINNYNEAMAGLSPAAQQFVSALGRVNAGLTNVRKSVSQKLFAGLGDQMLKLGNTWLPVIQSEAGKTAEVLNGAGRSFAGFARQASTVGRVRNIMSNNTEVVAELSKAIVPLVRAGLTLVQTFQPLGTMLAHYVSGWAAAIDKSTAAAEKSGRLAAVVDRMRTALAQAVRIAQNVGRALFATFSSVTAPGRTLLGMIEKLTAKWATWSASLTGKTAIAAWAASAIPVLVSLGGLIGDIGKMFSRLSKSGNAVGFVEQIRKILPPLERLLTQLSSSNAAGSFAEGIATIGRALADLGAGGTLAMAVEMVGKLLGIIVSFVQSVPGMTTVVKGLLIALAGLAAVRLTATIAGLAQLPRLFTMIDKGTGIIKGFTLSMIGMNSATAKTGVFTMATTAVRDFVNGLRIARLDMIATTGAAAGLRAGINGVTAAIAANPIGALIVGITAVATAIWAISSASKDATAKAASLNAELSRVGAQDLAAEVGKSTDELRKHIAAAKTYVEGFAEGPLKDLARQQVLKPLVDELVSIEAASSHAANTYGSNAQVIVANLRSMGLGAKTSSAEVLTAMDNVIAANNGVPISAERMQATLAAIYGLTAKDYEGAANTYAALNQQIANGYGVVSDAALDAAETQIQAMQLALKVQGGLGGYMEKELNAQIAGIEAYRTELHKQQAEAAGGVGAAIDGASAGAASAAKRQGAQTAAGWITSFTAEISELKAEDLLGHSARWTSIGSNIATYLAKGMTSGAKNITNVARYIGKKFGKTYVKQIQDAIAQYRSALTVFDPVTGKKQGKEFWEDRLQEIVSFKDAAYSALTEGADLDNFFGFIPTPEEVQRKLNATLDQMRGFTKGLEALQAKGLSKELAKQWLEAGADTAGNLVQGLQDATPEQIAEINKTYTTITDEAKKTADTQATKYFGTGQKQVENIIKGIESKTAAAEAKITTLMNKATAAAKKALNWTKLGEDTMNAFNTGVTNASGGVSTSVSNTYAGIQKNGEKTAKENGKKLAKAMLDGYNAALADGSKTTHKIIQAVLKGDEKAARAILKAGSPSKVWADIGIDTVAGYVQGMQQMQSTALSTVDGLYSAVTAVPAASLTPPTAKPGYASAAAYGAGAGELPPVFDVHVYVGDREIKDIVRVEAQQVDTVRARALYAGRTGG
jgi:hypothetical protein